MNDTDDGIKQKQDARHKEMNVTHIEGVGSIALTVPNLKYAPLTRTRLRQDRNDYCIYYKLQPGSLRQYSRWVKISVIVEILQMVQERHSGNPRVVHRGITGINNGTFHRCENKHIYAPGAIQNTSALRHDESRDSLL